MGIFDKLFGSGEGPTENGVRKISNVSEQTPDENKLVSFVKQGVEEARMSSSRITHEAIWMTNIAYILGYTGVFFDPQVRQFKTISRGSKTVQRNRIYVNKILPSVQNRLARLCKNPPKYDVRPNSMDTEDKEAARIGLQVLNMVWDQQAINQKRIPLFMWVQQCGHAYLKASWDDQLGKAMVDPQTGQMQGYEGDIRIDIVSPFEIFVDPLAKTLDEARHVTQAKVRPLNYFKTHYPENGELVKEEDAWLLSVQYDMRINSLNNRGQGQTGSQNIMKNSAIELVRYEKRSEKYPNGRAISTANGILLADKELPVGEIPFSKFDDIIIGGKFFSESTITHARSIQDQYNRVITLRADWTNKLLAGKYIAAKGHGLSQEALNDSSGEVVEYNPVPNAAPPMAMNIPVIPSYCYQEEDRLEKMMYDIFGINEISRGQLPSAGIPAVGMQFLMEQDDTRIGIVTESHEYSWAKLGQLILMYASKFMVMPRLLKEVGKNNEYAIKSFVGSDLRDNHDVIVIRGSTLPGSKVLRRQELINSFQQGFFGDPNDAKIREYVFKLLEYGDMAGAWQESAIDDAQIQKQIKEIEQEIIPTFNDKDNHQEHLRQKNIYRKGDKLAKLSDKSKMILEMDMEKHLQFLMNAANPGLKIQEQHIQQQMQDYQQQAQQTPVVGGPPPVEPPPTEGPGIAPPQPGVM